MLSSYPRPNEADLVPIPDHAASLQHHGSDTLIWEDEWWDDDDPAPIGVIPGHVGTSVVAAWLTGHGAGRKAGFRDGRYQGFRDCQAGLRALLGAGSAADVTTLLQAAAREGERHDR